jgi:signal transduction histidine kinase
VMILPNNPITLKTQIEFIKKHGKTGALAHLFMPLALLFITNFFQLYTFYLVTFSALVGILAFSRYALCSQWLADTNVSEQKWLGYFDLTITLQGLLIGIVGPFLLANYSVVSFQMQFYLLLIAIFALGSAMSLAVRPRTNLFFTISMFLPVSFANLILTQEESGYFLSLGIWSFLIFSLSQSKRMYQQQIEFNKNRDDIEFRDLRLHDFINSIPGMVIWLDSELKFQDMNENFLKKQQISRDSLIGNKIDNSNSPQGIVKQLLAFTNSTDKMFTTEIEHATDKETRYYLSVFTKHNYGQSTNISILNLDISDLKSKEQNLESQRMQLMENEKMVSLGELAGSIAHEVNNPLAIITGKAHVILHKIDHHQADLPTLRSYATHIYETAFRIKKIIESLRLLANEGRVATTEPYTIKDVIQPVLDITQNKLLSQKIELKLEHDNPGVKVVCGLIEMGQVLMNLIVNSIHAIETSDESKWIRIHSTLTDGKVQIRFSDCGLGIPEDIQKKIFTPFFTTKGIERGTGIGLSLSRRLLQKQGGDLYYESGCANTTFVIELPAAEKSIQNAA